MCPERWQSEQVRVLLSEKTTAASLESLYDLLGGMVGISLNKQVYVIRQDSELDDLPVLFGGDFADDLTKAIGKSPLEYLVPSGRAPYEMERDRVESVPTVAVCFLVYRHTLSTDGMFSGSRLPIKKSMCEHFFHRRRGPCIPPLKRGGGLLPLRTTPFI